MPKQKREIKGGSCSCGRGNVEMGISIRAAGGAQPQLLCFFRFCSYFLAFVTPTTRNPSIMQFSIFQQIETELPSPFFFFCWPSFWHNSYLRWQVENEFWFGFSFPLPSASGMEKQFCLLLNNVHMVCPQSWSSRLLISKINIFFCAAGEVVAFLYSSCKSISLVSLLYINSGKN